MTPVEFIHKANRDGYRFLYLSDTELLMSKTNSHPVGEACGFYACCTIDSLMVWHLVAHALALRIPIRWENET